MLYVHVITCRILNNQQWFLTVPNHFLAREMVFIDYTLITNLMH